MQSHELSPAVEAFARFLARVEDGETVDFDEFCARHSQFESELRRLHRQWSAMSDAIMEFTTEGGSDVGTGQNTDSVDLLARLSEQARRDDRYTDHSEIARGGMGTIVRVWDQELRRSLAMKVLTDADANSREVSRFLDEAQVTAQLDHPGIVPVHEVGLDARGRLYYTMPLIRGRDFRAIIELVHAGDEKWSLQRAVGILVGVAEAMAYAHSKGVIHRDLKPANIMVASFGETYVVDWGLARARGSEAFANPETPSPGELDPQGSIQTDRREVADASTDSPLLTSDGDIVGTPAYMPPEQARGEIGRLGVRSDIYAVGAILYHLLTGRVPFSAPGDRVSSHTILTRLLDRPPDPPRMIKPDLPAELSAICERAMAREPEDRFAEMMNLADNLRAFLEGRVVHAYESGALAELRKWIGRNRWLASASAIGLIVLIVGFVVSTSLFFSADTHAARADATARRLDFELSGSNVERGRLLAVAGNLGTAEDLIWREHVRGLDRRQSHWALWELYSLHPALAAVPAHDVAVYRIRTLADGSILTAGGDGKIKLWRDPSAATSTIVGDHGASIRAFAVSADGRLVASGGVNGDIALWDLRTRKLLRRRSAHRGVVNGLAFSPDGLTLVSCSSDHRVLIEDVRSGAQLELHKFEHPVTAVCFDRAGERIATACGGGLIHVWHPGRPKEGQILDGHKNNIDCLLFDHSGRTLWSGSWDRTIRIWDLKTGRSETLQTDNGATRELVLSADGKKLFASGWWRVDEWDVETRQRRRAFGIPQHAWGLAVSHDERVLISGHLGGVMRLWDLAPGRGSRRLERPAERLSVSVSLDGKVAATGDDTGAVWLWDAETGEPSRRIGEHEGRVKSVVFSSDGSILASGGMDSKVRLWRLRDRVLMHTFSGHASISNHDIAFDPKSAMIAFSCVGGGVELRDVESGELIRKFESELPQVINVQFDSSGEFLATSERYGSAKGKSDVINIWRRSGGLHRTIPVKGPWSVVFHPDGRRIMVGNWAKDVLVIDIETGRIQRTMPGHSGVVWSLALLPNDPNVLASGSADGTVRLWDLETGRNLIVLSGHTGGALGVSVSADGRTLVAGSAGGFAILHDLEYFDRHVAGNTELQIRKFSTESGAAAQVEDLSRWQSRVAERPWPRFR
jgi:eukaryotic-like serine/threonine-protein kinase